MTNMKESNYISTNPPVQRNHAMLDALEDYKAVLETAESLLLDAYNNGEIQAYFNNGGEGEAMLELSLCEYTSKELLREWKAAVDRALADFIK